MHEMKDIVMNFSKVSQVVVDPCGGTKFITLSKYWWLFGKGTDPVRSIALVHFAKQVLKKEWDIIGFAKKSGSGTAVCEAHS